MSHQFHRRGYKAKRRSGSLINRRCICPWCKLVFASRGIAKHRDGCEKNPANGGAT